jgi:hypothetical protein
VKKLKGCAAIVMVLAVLVSLNGCSLRISSFDNLIRPPKLSGKYQGLQDAFENSVDTDFDLQTPETGDYQSAFITYDCDSDGDEEAIVFYRTKDNSDIVKFSYFEYENDKWDFVKQFDGLGNSVDQVIFSDLNKDGKYEIIIGWGLFSSKTNKAFAVYEVSNNSINISNSYQYSYINVFDVNGDGYDDIFTMTLDSTIPEQLAAYARVYNFTDGSQLKMLSEAKTDGNISSYSSVTSEKNDEYNLIYIEANKGEHEMITELLYWDDDKNSLVAPLFDISSQSTKLTWRNNKAISYDVDSDKYLEIPTSVEMGGASVTLSDTSAAESTTAAKDATAAGMYFTKWVKFRDGKLKPVQYSIINDKLGYMLNIQSSWVGRITVSGTDGQWGYYRWDSSKSKRGELLFTINAYDKTNVDARKKYENSTTLTTSGNMVYVYSVTQAGIDFGVKDKILEGEFIITDFGGKK